MEIVKKFKDLSPRKLKRVASTVYHSTYSEDGLVARRIANFLYTPEFSKAYEAGKATGSWGTMDLRWRVFVACWAATQVKSLPGDFVECGVNRGGISRAVMEYIDFANTDRTFYLLDTYCGFPAGTPDAHAVKYGECYEDVRKTFSTFPNTQIIRGAVPETLPEVNSDRIAYLSIDMNCAEPEIAAAEFFWDKMAAGAVLLLDDYCYSYEHTPQNKAFNDFARSKGVEVLPIPTGQGLIVKPSTGEMGMVRKPI